jgi:hypothetical protein
MHRGGGGDKVRAFGCDRKTGRALPQYYNQYAHPPAHPARDDGHFLRNVIFLLLLLLLLLIIIIIIIIIIWMTLSLITTSMPTHQPPQRPEPGALHVRR